MHFPKRKVFLVLMLHSSVAIASLKDSCERLCRVICFCSTTEICGLLNALFLSLIFVVVVSCYQLLGSLSLCCDFKKSNEGGMHI